MVSFQHSYKLGTYVSFVASADGYKTQESAFIVGTKPLINDKGDITLEKIALKTVQIQIQVLDKSNNNPVSNATVSVNLAKAQVINGQSKSIWGVQYSDKDGIADWTGKSGQPLDSDLADKTDFYVNASKDGYNDTRYIAIPKDLLVPSRETRMFTIWLEPKATVPPSGSAPLPKSFRLVATVADANSGKEIPGAKVTLDAVMKEAPGVYSLDTDQLEDSTEITADANGYDTDTQSFTRDQLAAKYNAGRGEVRIKLLLKDNIDGLEVDCRPKEILQDQTAICKAVLHYKSGNTKDVSSAADWNPDIVDSPSKGKVSGQAVKGSYVQLPKTINVEAGYTASGEEGGQSWFGTDAVLVKGDEVDRFVVNCKPKEIVQDDTSTCSATLYYKSGKTKDISSAADWNPDIVDSPSKGKVSGQDVKVSYVQLPLTINVEAYYTASGEEGGQSWFGRDAVLVKGDEVDRFVVNCKPKEIFQDDTSTCSATLYYKSGKTKDVSSAADWNPDIVDSPSKGKVSGQDVKVSYVQLPQTINVEANYTASGEEGGQSWFGKDAVLVKQIAQEPPPQVKIQTAPNANFVKPGETVIYTYSVTNTGTTELENVKVADDKCAPVRYFNGDANGNSILDPGETWSYECSVALNATTANTAIVEAYTPGKVRASDRATAKVTVGPCPPSQVQVPYLLRMTEADGKSELQRNGLQGSATGSEYSTTFAEGTIMEQVPADRECVDANSTVGLVLSKGPNPEEAPVKEALVAQLGCKNTLELLPGEVAKSCGVMVKHWNSNTSERVEVFFPQQSNLGGDLVGDILAFPDILPLIRRTYMWQESRTRIRLLMVGIHSSSISRQKMMQNPAHRTFRSLSNREVIRFR